jgi:N-methylhydantoinase A
VPFGGAGPLHGCALAELLGISRVLITPAPGILCADGLLAADLKSEFSRALPMPGPMDPAVCEPIIAELEGQASAWLDAEDVASEVRKVERVALLRYAGQGGEIAVAYAPDRETVEENFRAAHKALYGFNLGAPIELVTLRVHATGLAASPPVVTLEPGVAPEPEEHTAVFIGGRSVDVPVIERGKLGAGARFEGPMILTQLDTTTYVAPGWRGEVHPSGGILLMRGEA